LELLLMLVQQREDIKSEIREVGLIQELTRYITLYPQADIDHNVLALTLQLLAMTVVKNKKNLELFEKLEGKEKCFQLISNLFKDGQNNAENRKIFNQMFDLFAALCLQNQVVQNQFRELKYFDKVIEMLKSFVQS